MKIIGNTVGTSLPKPDLRQTDPKKGDFVKGKEEFAGQSGLTAGQITALDNMFKICAYTEDASDAYKAFQTAFEIGSSGGGTVDTDKPEKVLRGLAAVYMAEGIPVGSSVEDIRDDLLVSAHYEDGSCEQVYDYTLSGTISNVGFNDVSVSYGGMTQTVKVTGLAVEPEEPEVTLASISATYSGGDVPAGTALNDLTGITVKANYSDGTSEDVTEYTISGTIAEGSNTITVSYGGKTTTFTVTGVAESGGDETTNILDGVAWTVGTLGRFEGTIKDYGGTGHEYSGFIPLNGATKVVCHALGGLRQIGYFFAGESADSVVGATVLETAPKFYISADNASYPSPVETEIPSGANYIIITRAVNVTDVTIELI